MIDKKSIDLEIYDLISDVRELKKILKKVMDKLLKEKDEEKQKHLMRKGSLIGQKYPFQKMKFQL